MRSLTDRLLLGLLAAGALVVGAWALLAPASFYDGFPGFGRAWVAVDGPYNEHLVRDFGGLQLAMAVVSAAGAANGRAPIARAVGAAWLVFSLPHLAYHVAHLDLYGPVDVAGNLVALGLQVLVPSILAVRRR